MPGNEPVGYFNAFLSAPRPITGVLCTRQAIKNPPDFRRASIKRLNYLPHVEVHGFAQSFLSLQSFLALQSLAWQEVFAFAFLEGLDVSAAKEALPINIRAIMPMSIFFIVK